MLVIATEKGFIYGQMKKPGDKFELIDLQGKSGIYKAKDQFSSSWMEEVKKPKKA